MSKTTITLALALCLLLAAFLPPASTFAFPAPEPDFFTHIEQQVAWAEFRKMPSQNLTVSGFVVFSQAAGYNPSMIMYGSFETGLNYPDSEGYEYIITPSNYDLTGKLALVYRQGATDPFFHTFHDMALSPNIKGTTFITGNLLEVRYYGKTIGEANINIVV